MPRNDPQPDPAAADVSLCLLLLLLCRTAIATTTCVQDYYTPGLEEGSKPSLR